MSDDEIPPSDAGISLSAAGKGSSGVGIAVSAVGTVTSGNEPRLSAYQWLWLKVGEADE